MTRIDIAKKTVTAIVGGVTTKYTKEALINHTSLEDGDVTVDVVSKGVGMVAACESRKYTDNYVEIAAAWIAKKRENKTEQ